MENPRTTIKLLLKFTFINNALFTEVVFIKKHCV